MEGEPDLSRQAMDIKLNVTDAMKTQLLGLMDKNGQLTLPDSMSDQVISYLSSKTAGKPDSEVSPSKV